ncbi:heavy-metal-associated domain-containing protein [Piscinibacter defluvii]|uniref:heavy-metal-associated domain-containing protein n=1 Tax=Piscinibacter defluvii TaxID=1796922 RepID=UPI000FDD955D|nr:heavy-metal-associated domain-containing protein [Piscinibacter defluvii]
MLAFQVNDMTCGHCAGAITKAVKHLDQAAKVTIDLAQHLVTVEPTAADGEQIRDAIAGAGYTPEPVVRPVADPAGTATTRTCCGSCH